MSRNFRIIEYCRHKPNMVKVGGYLESGPHGGKGIPLHQSLKDLCLLQPEPMERHP